MGNRRAAILSAIILSVVAPAAACASTCRSADVIAIKRDLFAVYTRQVKETYRQFDAYVPFVETDGLHAITGVGGKGWYAAYYQRVGSRWIHVGGEINVDEPIPAGWKRLRSDLNREPWGYWNQQYPVWSAQVVSRLEMLSKAPVCANPAYKIPEGP